MRHLSSIPSLPFASACVFSVPRAIPFEPVVCALAAKRYPKNAPAPSSQRQMDGEAGAANLLAPKSEPMPAQPRHLLQIATGLGSENMAPAQRPEHQKNQWITSNRTAVILSDALPKRPVLPNDATQSAMALNSADPDLRATAFRGDKIVKETTL